MNVTDGATFPTALAKRTKTRFNQKATHTVNCNKKWVAQTYFPDIE